MADDQQVDCPDCGSDNVIPIVYGLPGGQLQKAANEGKIKLGGCIVMENNPNWFCRECGHRWQGPEPDLDAVLGA